MKLSEIHITPDLDTLRFEDIDDATYFSEKYAGYISNSRLSNLNPEQGGSPEKFFGKSPSLYTDSIVFGSAIHELVLQPESFELVETVNRPTAKAGFMADELYKDYKETGEVLPSSIIKASNKIGYYKDSLTENKINKLLDVAEPYWEARLEFEKNYKGNKRLVYLDGKSRDKLSKCINALKSNQNITDLLYPSGFLVEPVNGYEKAVLLNVNVSFDDETIEPFVLRIKAKIDNYTIDTENNIIKVNDIKTHGSLLSDFPDAVNKYHYYRELSIYCWLLTMVAKKYYNMQNPEVESNFLVVSTVPEHYTMVTKMTKEMFKKGMDEFSKLIKLVAFYKVNGYDFQ